MPQRLLRQIASRKAAPYLDVLIVGRGGGSLEDLWAFNEEAVARALYKATVPTVSAVGHEIDFSIADLVADTRAATPSAAAELVSTDQNEVTQHLDMLTVDLSRSMSRRLSDLSHQLSTLKKRVRHPGHALKQQQAALARLNSALYLRTLRQLKAYRSQAEQLGSRLNAQHPKQQLSRQRDLCQHLRASVAAAYLSAPAGHAWRAQSPKSSCSRHWARSKPSTEAMPSSPMSKETL